MISKINATVLFVDDLDTCAAFYRDTLGFKVGFSDDASVAFGTKDQDFLLLKIGNAVEMVGEESAGAWSRGGQASAIMRGG